MTLVTALFATKLTFELHPIKDFTTDVTPSHEVCSGKFCHELEAEQGEQGIGELRKDKLLDTCKRIVSDVISVRLPVRTQNHRRERVVPGVLRVHQPAT